MSIKRASIEPGLLQLFRLSIGLRLGISILSLCLWLVAADTRAERFPFPGILETSLLMVYLSWLWLRQQLGRIYLPLALVIASVGPIIEYKLTVVARMIGGLPRGSLADDAWLLFVMLFVPLILISWQYNLQAVIGFSVATAFLDAFLSFLLSRAGGPPASNAITLILIRSLFFGVIGYIVTRLVKSQRQQREALGEANLQLARYAATAEQLAISRERNRIGRELHDTLAHSLSAVAVQLEAVSTLWEDDPQSARAMLAQSLVATRQGLTESRRAIQALRASPLEDMGLALSIRHLAESVAERSNLKLKLEVAEQLVDLAPEVEQGIYRIADQTLANVARHALARNLLVRLMQSSEKLQLKIVDDGHGFDPTVTPEHGHFGLRGLYERAQLIGGKLVIESRPGDGTTVHLTVNGKYDSRTNM